jgi:hypothetical protein
MKAKGAAEFTPLGRRPRDDPVLGSGKTNYVALAKTLGDSGA